MIAPMVDTGHDVDVDAMPSLDDEIPCYGIRRVVTATGEVQYQCPGRPACWYVKARCRGHWSARLLCDECKAHVLADLSDRPRRSWRHPFSLRGQVGYRCPVCSAGLWGRDITVRAL